MRFGRHAADQTRGRAYIVLQELGIIGSNSMERVNVQSIYAESFRDALGLQQEGRTICMSNSGLPRMKTVTCAPYEGIIQCPQQISTASTSKIIWLEKFDTQQVNQRCVRHEGAKFEAARGFEGHLCDLPPVR